MILAEHAYLGFPNKSKSRIRIGAHIFLSENDPKPKLNGPVLTISHIIKYVMESSAKSGIAPLYITPKNMAPLRNFIIEIGCPQPNLPI